MKEVRFRCAVSNCCNIGVQVQSKLVLGVYVSHRPSHEIELRQHLFAACETLECHNIKIPLQFDSHILYILNYLLTITVTEHCIQLLSATLAQHRFDWPCPLGSYNPHPNALTYIVQRRDKSLWFLGASVNRNVSQQQETHKVGRPV